MSKGATISLKSVWRWFGYAIITVVAMLSSLWIGEAMIAGMFMGWGGQAFAHAVFNLTLIAAEVAVILFAIRAFKAARRGDKVGTLIGLLACLAPVPIAMGVLASGLFEP
ncbi:MAG: hypothetical protein ACKOPE_07175 [Novosphingobium sp.]